jgi:hypothetical protein
MTSQALFALDHVPAGSLHFGQFDSADLPWYKILRSRFLNVPMPFGMLLEVSPEGRHTSDRLYYPTVMKRSGCDVCESELITQLPLLVVFLFFRVPEALFS